MEPYDPVCYKVPSASLTDHELLRKVKDTGKPMLISTGMSTMEQIEAAVLIIAADSEGQALTRRSFSSDDSSLS